MAVLLMFDEFYLFTCIREPISFHISQVNYFKKIRKNSQYSYDNIFRNKQHQNYISKYYLKNHPNRWKNFTLNKKEVFEQIKIMDKVFVLENLSYLYHWLEEITGVVIKEPEKKLNVGKYVLMPTDEQVERLRHINNIDEALYNHFKSLQPNNK